MNQNKVRVEISKGVSGSGSGQVAGIVVQKNGVIRAVTLKRPKSGSTK